MINTKRLYEQPSNQDGWRVLVDRIWPRGVTKQSMKVDVWFKEIAPSNELRRWFAHTPEKWPEFQKRYRAELAQKKDLLTTLKEMEKEHGTVTLLFGAKDEQHNQAVALAQILKKR